MSLYKALLAVGGACLLFDIFLFSIMIAFGFTLYTATMFFLVMLPTTIFFLLHEMVIYHRSK